MKIPKDFQDKEELDPIMKEVTELNKKLESICVFRSYRSKKTRKVHTIHKKWLQLVFAECSTGVTRHPPLPRVIHIHPKDNSEMQKK